MLPRAWVKNGWTGPQALLGLAMIALAVGLTWAAWAQLITVQVMRPGGAYILVAPLVAGWMFWVRRARLVQCRLTGTWLGPGLALAGLLVFGYSGREGWTWFWHLGALMTVMGSLISVIGNEAIAAFRPALGMLCFMLPIPEACISWSQQAGDLAPGLAAWPGLVLLSLVLILGWLFSLPPHVSRHPPVVGVTLAVAATGGALRAWVIASASDSIWLVEISFWALVALAVLCGVGMQAVLSRTSERGSVSVGA